MSMQIGAKLVPPPPPWRGVKGNPLNLYQTGKHLPVYQLPKTCEVVKQLQDGERRASGNRNGVLYADNVQLPTKASFFPTVELVAGSMAFHCDF